MKTPLILFAVIAIVTGYVAAESKPGDTVPILTTNTPTVVDSVAVEASTIPDCFTVRLDAETLSNLVQAIKVGGKITRRPIQVVLTNTNSVSFPNSIAVTLGETTLASLSPRPEAWWKNFIPLFATLIGAVIAFVSSFWAITHSHNLQIKRKEKEDAKFVRNILKSIEAELDALSGIFNQGIGGKLKEKNGRMFLVRLALSQDYFTVYGANAANLGKINPETAKAIISLYQTMKALIENFRINNEYINMHDAVMHQWKTAFAVRPEGLVQRGLELEGLLSQQGDELVRLSVIVEQQYKALKKVFGELN